MIATSVFFTSLQLNREVGKYSVHEEIAFEVGLKAQARFSMTEKGRMEAQRQGLGVPHRKFIWRQSSEMETSGS